MQTEVQCPTCGTLNPHGKVFCMSCSNALMGSPGSRQGAGSGAQGVQTTALPPPPAPPTGPISTLLPPTSAYPQSFLATQQPQEQPSGWPQPTQAYPPPGPYSPGYGQATPQPPYAQPAPYPAPSASYQPQAQNPQYTQPAPVSYQQPTAPYSLPPQQYDPYGNPISAAPQQYGQYGQYGPPNQYVNVQITGAYPQGPYGAQPVATTPAVQRNPVAFWGLWLLATAIAWAIAVPAGFAIWDAIDEPLINNVFRGILSSSSNAVLSLIIIFSPLFLILGVVVGLVSGILQALIMGWKGFRAGSWVSTTVIGWALGAIAGWIVWVLLNNTQNQFLSGPSAGLLGDSPLVSGLLTVAVFGAVAGAVLGVVQYFGLQKHTRKAGLWILASPLAWAIAAVALALVTNMIMQSSFGLSLNPYVAEALYGAAIGAVAGATTGAVMAAIL